MSPDSSIVGDTVCLLVGWALLPSWPNWHLYVEHSWRLVTLETCNQSDNETGPDEQKDNDKDIDNENDHSNLESNFRIQSMTLHYQQFDVWTLNLIQEVQSTNYNNSILYGKSQVDRAQDHNCAFACNAMRDKQMQLCKYVSHCIWHHLRDTQCPRFSAGPL